MLKQTLNFPFTAVSGQTSFKLALILTAINPAIGGVLISGPRGSAKSTLARGLADVMPAKSGKRHDFVTLPLGASEEMLVGTLDLQKVLTDQSVAFQPGLLARADGGVLYVDEVNLLADNLVDLLLDVSTSGVNRVERDGLSHSHSAEFILLGTMNPDEGELRPQLLDRFGLSVELRNQYSVSERVEIVQLREAFDRDPEAFIVQYQHAQDSLTQRIETAKKVLNDVHCNDDLRIMIAERCMQAKVDGVRGDIVWYRAAVAHAAWNQRTVVTEEDVLAVEELVLAHRRNSDSSQDGSSASHPPSSGNNSNEESKPEKKTPFSRPPESQFFEPEQDLNPNNSSNGNSREAGEGDWGSMNAPKSEQQNTSKLPWNTNRIIGKDTHQQRVIPKLQLLDAVAGQNRKGLKGQGQSGQFNTRKPGSKVDWFASIIHSVKTRNTTVDSDKRNHKIKFGHLVFRNKQQSQAVLHLILLDTSASVLKQQSFGQAKSLVSAIANQTYLAREQLTLMGFGNQKVTTLLPKKRAPKSLLKLLDSTPAAGGTPLREMIQSAFAYQQQQVAQSPDLKIQTYLITDGRTSQNLTDLSLLGQVTVIDTEQSQVKRGKASQIAQTLFADYLPLAQLVRA